MPEPKSMVIKSNRSFVAKNEANILEARYTVSFIALFLLSSFEELIEKC